MVDFDPLPLLEYMQLGLNEIIKRIEVLIGGLFGLYLVFFVLNYLKEKKTNKLLKEIRDELRVTNAKLTLSTTKKVKRAIKNR